LDTTFWVTLLLFSLTYLGLAVGKVPRLRVDRAGIALVGATAMLVAGAVPFDEAVSARCVNYEALALLFGMMVVVAVLRLSGFFARLASWGLTRVRSPRGLLALTIGLSGVLSAFLVNDIVCIALTPLLLDVARRLRYDPVPHLIGLATAANIGSSGAITGNPQNMIIGIQSRISYLRFSAKLFPVALLGLVVAYLLLSWLYRRRLAVPADAPAEQHLVPAPPSRSHARLQRKAVLVALVTVALFFALPSQHLALIALSAASVLLLGRVNPEKIYRQIDWTLLVLFAGLFIVVYAFRVHVVELWRVDTWTWLLDRPVDLLSVVSAALSNLVSNVPAVLLFEPVMRAMPEASRETAWLALAMSSTLAGNLTVLGSVANLIVVEAARRDGVEVSFTEYCKVGVPLTLLTLLLGVAWLTFAPY
jgi:Na+/H+ antiporter NhaD/arsenite permease-like protein